MNSLHEPVLLREVLSLLAPQPNQNFVDCTFGGGGHALAILERIKPRGKLIGIDWDPQTVQDSRNENLILVNDNYKNLKSIVHDSGINKIDGILLDLGLSSDQLGQGDRGFSFQSQGFLDLRFNPAAGGRTAAEILRDSDETELFRIFKEYGEEPLAGPLAKTISANRRQGQTVETAEMLVQLVSKIYQKYFHRPSRKNPATRVFQALRVAVNDEFGNILSVLPQAVAVLRPGGRLAVISFHSGEDRLVKNFLRQQASGEEPNLRLLTKKPVTADEEETEQNPRSRSAKLRAAEKILGK